MVVGAGYSSSGFSSGGYGEPTSPTQYKQQEWKLQGTNQSGQGRYINPQTGDYEFDQNGFFRGMISSQQMVYLAFATVRGTAAQFNMGQNLYKTRTIGGNYAQLIKSQIDEALSDLINNNIIILLSVETVRTKTNALMTNVNWMDANSKETYKNVI